MGRKVKLISRSLNLIRAKGWTADHKKWTKWGLLPLSQTVLHEKNVPLWFQVDQSMKWVFGCLHLDITCRIIEWSLDEYNCAYGKCGPTSTISRRWRWINESCRICKHRDLTVHHDLSTFPRYWINVSFLQYS